VVRRSAIYFAALTIATGILLSCEDRPFNGYLADNYKELMNRTVTLDASNVTLGPEKRTQWSDTISWEFDSKLAPQQYGEWVTSELAHDFRIVTSGNDVLVFAKDFSGDTESIVIRLNSGHDILHVRVVVSVAPD
jgi:hypothetical protein